jgi:hypothetical protein
VGFFGHETDFQQCGQCYIPEKMSDFDTTQLNTDLAAICATTMGGESFVTGGVTYSGIFNQLDQVYAFEQVGNSTNGRMTLVVNRAAYTPTINALVYRSFDSITYRITDFKPDLQAFEISLNTFKT